MNQTTLIVLVVLLYSSNISGNWQPECNNKYVYPKLYYYKQMLDHFDPTVDETFHQRYFVSDQYWNKRNGPIFFYTGNEGDITTFINNTGFLWDIAPIFQALVVFAEHRYYGHSKPYGDIQPSLNTSKKFAQLTAEQALADYAELVMYIKETYDAVNCAVIAFGGSYGGMLSSWMRIKYGHIVDGAIAASAPVNNFRPDMNCDSFNSIVTQDFLSTENGFHCVDNIRRGWEILKKTAEQPGGLSKLKSTFHLCKNLQSGNELVQWMISCWGNMAMVDYPYPANFLTSLPAWPVNVTCEKLSKPLEGDDLLHGLYEAISVYANFTGNVSCFDTDTSETASISNTLWDYQSCTEMVMPECATGVSDMFPPSKWDYNLYAENCKKMYGVNPRPKWVNLSFGGIDLKSSSNIVFSNGILDPWHLGGVLHNITDSVISVVMWGSAHHLDLRHHNPKDPVSVIQCRETEMLHITKWIAEKYKRTQHILY